MSTPVELFGKSAFTPEELDTEAQEEAKRKREYEEKINNGFFQDGISRRIVLDNIIKEDAVGKTSGKPYTKHTYFLRDVETGQTEICDIRNHSFAFTDALKPVKKELGAELRLGVTVLELMAQKTGGRTFGDFTYPEFEFSLSVYSNDPKAAATMRQAEPPLPNETQIDTKDIPF